MILGFFSSSFSRKIHHPRLLSSPNITGFFALCGWMLWAVPWGLPLHTPGHITIQNVVSKKGGTQPISQGSHWFFLFFLWLSFSLFPKKKQKQTAASNYQGFFHGGFRSFLGISGGIVPSWNACLAFHSWIHGPFSSQMLGGGWTNPFETYEVKMGSSSPNKGENQKWFETTT